MENCTQLLYTKHLQTALRTTDLIVNEIYVSIQGESTFAGQSCVFVRLAGCPLRCVYCDTPYALVSSQGAVQSLDSIVKQVARHNCSIVEITGGEPLAQPQTPRLCQQLIAAGWTVLVETAGSHDISVLPEEVIRIMDIKTPGSKMDHHFLSSNLQHLRPQDEVKFVICSEDDFFWAKQMVETHALSKKCTVLFSPAFEMVDPALLSKLILTHTPDVRLNLQLHKFIWDPKKRGV